MALKPISYYGKFQPTGVDQSGAKRMQALAGLAEQVGGMAEQFGIAKAEKLAPEQAAKDAREAAKKGDELRKRDPLAWGAQVYNSVAVATYEANLKVDLDEAMINAYKNNLDNIEGYQKLADAAFEGLTSKAPESVKANLDLFYRQRNSKYAKPINDETQKNIVAQQRGNLQAGLEVSKDNISNLTRNGNEEESLEARLGLFFDLENAVKSGVITPLYAEQQKAAIDDDVAKQVVLGQLDRTIFDESLDPEERIQKGEEFISDLIKSDIPNLNPAQKDALVKTVNAKVQSEQIAYSKEQNTLTQAEERQKADLVRKIKTGQISGEKAYEKIDQFFKDGLIKNENELITYEGFVISKTKSALKVENDISNVNKVLQGERPSEPLNQKAVNTYYESIQSGLPEDPEARSVYQADLVQSTRYVPSMVKTELRNNLISRNPEKVLAATNTMDRILNIAGMSEEFTPQELAFADQVIFNMDYMDADKAIQMARTNTDTDNTALVDARTKAIKDNKKVFSDAYSNEVDDAFMGFREDFQNNPDAAAQMTSDYGRLVETYYKAGSSIESAKSRAISALQTNWIKSEFGLMKYAPEQYYGVGIDNSVSYIKKDIYDLVKPVYDDREVTFTEDDIFLKSDDETARLASQGKPTYSVLIKTSDGTLQRPMFIDNNGNIVDRYEPDEELIESVKQSIILENKQKADEIIANRPYRQRTFQKIAKELGVDDTPKEHTGGRFEGGSAELDRRFRTPGLAESLDTIGSALDRVTYTPLEMLEDVAVKIGRKSDEYIESLKKDK